MHSTCPDRSTKAARRYISPRARPLTREEAEIRALAYAVKNVTCDEELVEAAARAMALLIEGESGYLIPAPNHNGDTCATARLACAIAKNATGAWNVADILTRDTPTESQCERHRRREKPLEPENHRITLRKYGQVRITTGTRIYFVDNVITSGNTIEACRRALGGLGTGLVYADAHNDQPN